MQTGHFLFFVLLSSVDSVVFTKSWEDFVTFKKKKKTEQFLVFKGKVV